jgi:septal ring factor EnvC (AmiA/AmiB activator)
LTKEQKDDDDKKVYCDEQFDLSDDKKKSLEGKISDSETAIDELTGSIATTKEEIEALEDGIRALDKSVAEATEQRKKEHEDYEAEKATNTKAKELLGFAMDRLNQFYNPKLAKPPPAFVQIAEHSTKGSVAPPPPPETFDGYTKKSEESSGVIQMIKLLVTDLEKEMTEHDVSEKDAQEDYEALMSDSKAKRAEDSKSLTSKESSKASKEEALQAEKTAKDGSLKELMATEEYIASLHGECDWLLKYFNVRKEARTSEIDSLQKAKAVLSGADFSLVQTARGVFLRR